jgi:hypothetical protein
MIELGRQQHHAVPDADIAGALRDRRQEHLRRRRMGEFLQEMMLDLPYGVKAVPIGGFDLLDRLPVGIVFGVRAPWLEHFHFVEQVDFHNPSPGGAFGSSSCPGMPRYITRSIAGAKYEPGHYEPGATGLIRAPPG